MGKENMPKHDNALHNVHLRKHWQKWVRCNFNQAGRKQRRLNTRKAKAQAVFPRPIKSLRPQVRGCTRRYNRLTRSGKGFTLAELAAAKISHKFAKTVGISVDHRRTNKSTEGKATNVERLKAYKERMVLLPRHKDQPKKCAKGHIADATNDQVANVAQTVNLRDVMPIKQDVKRLQGMKITKDMQSFKAHRTIRQEWSNMKNDGKRRANIPVEED